MLISFRDKEYPEVPGLHDGLTAVTRRTLARFGWLDRKDVQFTFEESVNGKGEVKVSLRVWLPFQNAYYYPEPWVFAVPFNLLAEHGPHLSATRATHARWVESAAKNVEYNTASYERSLDHFADIASADIRYGYEEERLRKQEPGSIGWAKRKLAVEAAWKHLERLKTDKKYADGRTEKAKQLLDEAVAAYNQRLQDQASHIAAEEALHVRCVQTTDTPVRVVAELYDWPKAEPEPAPAKVVDLMAALEESLAAAKKNRGS
jgi:hypothetical protein